MDWIGLDRIEACNEKVSRLSRRCGQELYISNAFLFFLVEDGRGGKGCH